MRHLHWKIWMGGAAAALLLAAAPGLAEQAFEPNRPSGEAPARAPGADAPDPTRMEAPAQPAAAEAAEEYVVEEGDTLATIAEEKLGSAERWKQLARANGIDEPEKLRVGQKLRIPSDRRS